MVFGISFSKKKQKSTSTTNQNVTPTFLPQFGPGLDRLTSKLNEYADRTPDQLVAGLTDDEKAGIGGIRRIADDPTFNNDMTRAKQWFEHSGHMGANGRAGVDAIKGSLAQPTAVTDSLARLARETKADQVAYDSSGIGSASNRDVASRDISAMRIAGKELDNSGVMSRMSPYLDAVVDAQGKDLDRRAAIRLANSRARRAGAKAWGDQGENADLVEQYDLEDLRNKSLAELRDAGFGRAVDWGTSDMDRVLRGDQSNQSTDLAAQTSNQRSSLEASLANQRADLERSTFNANLNKGIADSRLNAATTNQGANLQAAGLNNAAAGTAAGIAQGQQGLQQSGGQSLANIGAQQQGLQQGAAQGLAATGGQQVSTNLATQGALINAGGLQRSIDQAKNDALENQIGVIGNVVFGAPTGQTGTATTTGSASGTGIGASGSFRDGGLVGTLKRKLLDDGTEFYGLDESMEEPAIPALVPMGGNPDARGRIFNGPRAGMDTELWARTARGGEPTPIIARMEDFGAPDMGAPMPLNYDQEPMLSEAVAQGPSLGGFVSEANAMPMQDQAMPEYPSSMPALGDDMPVGPHRLNGPGMTGALGAGPIGMGDAIAAPGSLDDVIVSNSQRLRSMIDQPVKSDSFWDRLDGFWDRFASSPMARFGIGALAFGPAGIPMALAGGSMAATDAVLQKRAGAAAAAEKAADNRLKIDVARINAGSKGPSAAQEKEAQYLALGVPADWAKKIAYGLVQVNTSPIDGETTLIDQGTRQRFRVDWADGQTGGAPGAAVITPAADDTSSLFGELAKGNNPYGAWSALKSGVGKTVGQFAPGVVDQENARVRALASRLTGQITRAMAMSNRPSVYEQKALDKYIPGPDVLESEANAIPALLQARSMIEANIKSDEEGANDRSLPVKDRQDMMMRAREFRSVLKMIGEPPKEIEAMDATDLLEFAKANQGNMNRTTMERLKARRDALRSGG